MTAKRTDATQPEIVAALRKIGAFVVCTHTVGKGFPDLVFAFRGKWYLAECKNRFLGWKLTTAQKDFHGDALRAAADILVFDGAESVMLWVSRRFGKKTDPRGTAEGP